ncbi:PQQ-dependent sugar dehydrogenase [Paraflavitalea speifideaquila]|uniref:PQQ-dependent sugar dehydrogenase n=1 Tax=Paraflavitalea speifideaquila TaxID=3076558 RepID=UPI0028E926F9|nr:PQQ-dependent sugar dehydrogenase [Paraflavitalea speifideiaquila]
MTNTTPLHGRFLPGLIVYLLLACTTLQAQPVLTFTPVIPSGLSAPVDVVNASDGTNRFFIVERGGTIKAYDASFNLLGTFLTVTGITSGGERGLLSMAFHPAYATNRYFFVHYTNAVGDVEIARYQVQAGNPNLADPSSKTVILTIEKPIPETNHNGGKLNFGPDGYLYFAAGDGGGSGDERNYAQRGDSLMGKMIRIDVGNFTTPPYYSIPADNPYISATDTLHAIWAFGLRNPWRWSFDRSTGDMWIADVGQDGWEEINFRPAAATGNVNYGWRCYEANAPFNSSGCLPAANYISPIFSYPHDNVTGGFAVTGGYVYRGSQFPTLAGYYICADYISNNVWLIKSNGGTGWQVTQQGGLPGRIASFGEAENGELYALSLTAGALFQVAVSSALPLTLLSFTAKAQTGYNELRWKTSREINLQQFDLEYSNDGSAWIKAGTVLTDPNNVSPEYYFKHPTHFEGRMYYRLKSIDKDATYTYSKIISLDTDPEKGMELQLFPTVITYGQLQVQLNEPFANLQLFNMQGQMLITQNLQNQTGIIRLDVSGFNKGVYTVIASRPDKKVSKSFRVQ